MRLSITMIAIPVVIILLLLLSAPLKKYFTGAIADREINLKHVFWLVIILIAIWIFFSLILIVALSLGHSRPPNIIIFSRIALSFSIIVIMPCAILFLYRFYENTNSRGIFALIRQSIFVLGPVIILIVTLSLVGGIYPPLAFAMRNGFSNSSEWLIKMKITLNKEDYNGFTPLEYAAIRDDMPKLIMMLDSGVEINGHNKSGANALKWACIWGNRSMAELLIDRGVNVNVRYTPENIKGWTPLFIATNWGHLDLVKALIEKGADLNIYDARGKTVLMIAEEKKQTDIISFLKTMEQTRNND